MPSSHTKKPHHTSAVGVFRFSVAGFLASIIILFLITPFLERFENGLPLESSMVTIVLVFGVMAVGHRRRTLVFGLLLLAPVTFCKWMNHFVPSSLPFILNLAFSLVFLLFIVYQFMRFILRAPRVDSEVVCAGISVYLLIGLVWALAYMLTAWLVPNSFYYDGQVEAPREMNNFTSVYFSFVTLSTVGYGDITPVSPTARTLAAAEAMTGTLFVAILISRLVSLYSRHPSPPDDAQEDKKK